MRRLFFIVLFSFAFSCALAESVNAAMVNMSGKWNCKSTNNNTGVVSNYSVTFNQTDNTYSGKSGGGYSVKGNINGNNISDTWKYGSYALNSNGTFDIVSDSYSVNWSDSDNISGKDTCHRTVSTNNTATSTKVVVAAPLKATTSTPIIQEEITFKDLVELLITLNLIPQDKIQKARTLATTIDTAEIVTKSDNSSIAVKPAASGGGGGGGGTPVSSGVSNNASVSTPIVRASGGGGGSSAPSPAIIQPSLDTVANTPSGSSNSPSASPVISATLITQEQPLACTSSTYSDWSSCVSSGVQTKQLISSFPLGCSGASPVLSQSCTYTPACTDSNWTSTLSPTICPSTGTQTKSWAKVGACNGGTTHPSVETSSCNYQIPTCTSFTYSDWSSCGPSGTQTRQITTSAPSNCAGGSPTVSQSCVYVPTCTDNNWTYVLSPLACPQTSVQNKVWTKVGNCSGGVAHSPTESIACNYQAPTCTSFIYSDWGACSSSGNQTRQVAISYPSSCIGGAPVLNQSCTYINPNQTYSPGYVSSMGKEIGVDYHALGTAFESGGFIVRYNDSVVRQTVRNQLIQMKQQGITTISTRIWLNWVTPNPSHFGGTYNQFNFPLNDQEASNLRQYTQDVSDIGGLNLSLIILGNGWNVKEIKISSGCSETECPSSQTLPSATIKSYFLTSIDKILASVSDITNKDGTKTINKIYLWGEVCVSHPFSAYVSNFNKWLMKDSGIYNYFRDKTLVAGLEPTTYFLVNANGVDMDRYLYTTLRYFKENSLPIPNRIDFSFYVEPSIHPTMSGINTYSSIINYVFNDLDSKLPGLLGRMAVPYYVQETNYWANSNDAIASQTAWKNNFYRNNFVGLNFWTTPLPYAPSNVFEGPSIKVDTLYSKNMTGTLGYNLDQSICVNGICTANINQSTTPSTLPRVLSVELDGTTSVVSCVSSNQTISVPWIQTGKNYIFSLYNNSDGSCSKSVLIENNRLTSLTINVPSATQQVSCTSFTYSDWGACSSSGNQTRQVVSSLPANCSGGSPSVTQSCTYTPPVSTCSSFTYSDWGICINGSQSRSIMTSAPTNCTGGNPVLNQTCSGATITASPNPCTIPMGQNTCSSTITWDAPGNPNACIFVSAGGMYNLFSCSGASGSQVAPWIIASGDTFDLRASNSKTAQLLASVSVMGQLAVNSANLNFASIDVAFEELLRLIKALR